MARTRLLKPEFFTDSDLCALEPLARLLFEGLWCHADRAGRLVDKPKEIQAKILPYDDCNVDILLAALSDGGFVIRYEHESRRYIQIKNFTRHQSLHAHEQPSKIPPPLNFSDVPYKSGTSTGQVPDKYGTSTDTQYNTEQEQEQYNTKDKKRKKQRQPYKEIDPKPLWNDCSYFRMDTRGYELTRQWYARERLPEQRIARGIEVVENWLAQGSTAKARAARSSADHFRYLREPWVLEKAERLENCISHDNDAGVITPYATASERKAKREQEAIDRARARDDNQGNLASANPKKELLK